MAKEKNPAWFNQLPLCACDLYDPHVHLTVKDMAWTIRTELDLIIEEQDGTDPRHKKPLMRWLKQFAPELLTS